MVSTTNQGTGQPNKADEGVLSRMATAVKQEAQDLEFVAEDAWGSTRNTASSVTHTAEDAWGKMTGLMRRYPFGTLCVGIGVGFLISRLLEDRGTRDFRRMGSDLYDRVRDYASEVASKVRS